MIVADLIKCLQGCDPADEVQGFDPESEQWESVSGLTQGGGDAVVKLYTDEL